MYDITNYYKIGSTTEDDDLRSTNRFTVRTEIFTNGKNFMVLEINWASYVGTTRTRLFLENELDLNRYAGQHFIAGTESIKTIN